MQMRTKIVAVVKLQKPQPADEGGYSRYHSGGEKVEQLSSPDNVGERRTRAKVVKGERHGGTDVKQGMCRPGH